MMDLARFLQMAASRPVDYGSWDCKVWLADWLVACGHPDPAADYRGRYRTALGAQRLLKREGGCEALICRLADRAGLKAIEPSEAKAGDIGLLPIASRRGPDMVGGLCTGARWAALGFPAGIVAHPFFPRLAWSVL